jgi:hypothetical protein
MMNTSVWEPDGVPPIGSVWTRQQITGGEDRFAYVGEFTVDGYPDPAGWVRLNHPDGAHHFAHVRRFGQRYQLAAGRGN